MRTNDKNNESKNGSRYTRKAIADMKAALNAEYFMQIDLVKYGIQIYNVTPDNEYNVVISAKRDIINGRYYFITREGDRVAWSSLTTDQLIHACVDFMDQMTADETTSENGPETIKEHVTAVRVADIARTVADACALCYGSPLITSDMALDIDRFLKVWLNKYNNATDTTDPAAPFIFAIRRQGSESGTIEHVAERCKVLGSPVYVIKVERENDADGRPVAGRYTLTVTDTTAETADRIEREREANKSAEFVAEFKERKAIEADTCESDPAETIARAEFYKLSESKRKAIRYAAHLIATGATVADRGAYLEIDKIETCARVTIDAADADHLRHLLTRKAEAGERIAKDCEARELTDAAEVAATRASRCKAIADTLRKAARLVLLAVTLTTGTPADAETIESEPQAADVAELLTTDPARELADLRAAGLTVTRYEIKTAPATLREVSAC